MKVKWLGHSSFLITSSASGGTLLTDPYDIAAYPDSLLYDAITESADVVTVSHGHADHANIEAVGGTPEVVTAAAPRDTAGFNIRGVETFHDAEMGTQRGDNIIFIIAADGVVLCHLGDLGHELSPGQVEAIGPVDILLVPVGGNYTIDAPAATIVWRQLNPAVAVPMHYRNDKCRLAIEGVEPFIAGKEGVETPGTSEIELTQENLPASPKIIVLDPAN